MKTYKFIIALIAMASLATAGAQTASVTPYSRIGYGMLGENATGIQRQMGGVGYAAQNGRQINVMNPASYSQTDSITFLWDLGIDLTNVWSKEGDKSGYSFAGGLDYITSAFRLGKGVGASIGVVPFSNAHGCRQHQRAILGCRLGTSQEFLDRCQRVLYVWQHSKLHLHQQQFNQPIHAHP